MTGSASTPACSTTAPGSTPAQPSDHGYGLWLARQLCAAVDVGNDESGTHVRLHARTRTHSD